MNSPYEVPLHVLCRFYSIIILTFPDSWLTRPRPRTRRWRLRPWTTWSVWQSWCSQEICQQTSQPQSKKCPWRKLLLGKCSALLQSSQKLLDFCGVPNTGALKTSRPIPHSNCIRYTTWFLKPCFRGRTMFYKAFIRQNVVIPHCLYY